jgi:hypothetical protein
MNRPNSIATRVSRYIENHPGTTRAEIVKALGPDVKPHTISSTLGVLRRGGAIENRGGWNKFARWYSIDEEVSNEYIEFATKLLDELRTVHPTHRAEYLAKRIQDMTNHKE